MGGGLHFAGPLGVTVRGLAHFQQLPSPWRGDVEPCDWTEPFGRKTVGVRSLTLGKVP